MTDDLATASDWLRTQRRSHMARSVTYRRGAESASVSATFGKTVFRVDANHGLFEQVETHDFIVDYDDLADTFGEPQRGDQIVATLNDAAQVFEVMAPGNESHYRWHDRQREELRIHTKHVGADA